MITILVGDVTEYLAQEAYKIDPQAILITQDNFKDLADGVYYTSLGDCKNRNIFFEALNQAQHLIYCPPLVWSDKTLQEFTESQLFYFINDKQITGQDKLLLNLEEKQVMLCLADVRKTSGLQLWIAGCSVSQGMGVSLDQRYGHLLAQKLGLPVSFLTQNGSSVQWAADQILRSDIKAGDIVVWGLTNFSRMPFYTDKRVLNINFQYYKQNQNFNKILPIERLDDDNMAYNNIVSIHAVNNFCDKLQAHLFIFGLLGDHYTSRWSFDLPKYKQFYGRFEFEQGKFLDFGNDKKHPGPRTHHWYCDEMFQIVLKRLGVNQQ